MKVLIFTGMVIVFISVFFILFIFDVLVRAQIPCVIKPFSDICTMNKNGMALVVGLTIIALFFLVDIVTVWLIFKALFEKTQPFFRITSLFY